MPKAKYSRKPNKEELYRLYAEDEKSMTTIANMFDTSSSMVYYWMKSAHIDSRPRGKYNRKPERDELHRLYVDEFVSIPKLSEMFGCSISTVQRWMVAMNIDRRPHYETRLGGRQRISVDDLYKLYITDQIDVTNIAQEYGFGYTTIHRWLCEAGIKIRSSSEVHLKGKKKPSDADLHKMYLEDGMTTVDIGNTCGVEGRTVWRWLAMCGITPRSHKDAKLFGKTIPSKEELHQMYTIDNMSMRQIGEKVGVCGRAIGQWLSDHDIYIRSVSESLMGKWVGENNPSWRGGSDKYCHKFNESFKESVRDEFGRQCFLCGKSEEDNGVKLSVHHVSYNKNAMCKGGGRFVPLCISCHGKTNGNRFYWYSLIMCKLLLESSAQYVITDLNI